MKRKKLYGILLVVVILIGIGIAYLFRSMTRDDIYSEPKFRGTVQEVSDKSVLVAVNPGEEILRSSDLISVSLDTKLKDSMTHFNVGDEVIIYYDGNIAESYPAQVYTVYAIELMATASSSSEDAVGGDQIPMLMVNGKLYYDTGKESDIGARCGVMDGEITSTVDASEIPNQDDQSNFGSGYGYQFVNEQSIDVYMNEKWIRFETRE